MAMLSVPIELLSEAGIDLDGILEMFADGHNIIIRNADDPGGFVCNGDCESCPMSEIDCTSDCESCPCKADCDDSEAER